MSMESKNVIILQCSQENWRKSSILSTFHLTDISKYSCYCFLPLNLKYSGGEWRTWTEVIFFMLVPKYSGRHSETTSYNGYAMSNDMEKQSTHKNFCVGWMNSYWMFQHHRVNIVFQLTKTPQGGGSIHPLAHLIHPRANRVPWNTSYFSYTVINWIVQIWMWITTFTDRIILRDHVTTGYCFWHSIAHE